MFCSTGDHHQGYIACSYVQLLQPSYVSYMGVWWCIVFLYYVQCSPVRMSRSYATSAQRALHVVQEDNTPPHAHVANITRL